MMQGDTLNVRNVTPRPLERYEYFNPGAEEIVIEDAWRPESNVRFGFFDQTRNDMIHWLENRRDIASEMFRDKSSTEEIAVTRGNEMIDAAIQNLKNVRYIQSHKKEDARREYYDDPSNRNVVGAYFPNSHAIAISPKIKNSHNFMALGELLGHELAHATRLAENPEFHSFRPSQVGERRARATPENESIRKDHGVVYNKIGEFAERSKRYNAHLQDPEKQSRWDWHKRDFNEIYSRIMEVRRALGVSPEEKINTKHIKKMILHPATEGLLEVFDEEEVAELMNSIVYSDTKNDNWRSYKKNTFG